MPSSMDDNSVEPTQPVSDSRHPLRLASLPDDPASQAILALAITAPSPAMAEARARWQAEQAEADRRRTAAAGLTLGLVLNRADRYLEAQSVLRSVEPALAAMGVAPELAICRWQLGVAARLLRQTPEFLEQLEAAQAQLAAAGLSLDATRCLRDLAAACNWRGQYERSAQLTAEARAVFAAHDLPAEAAACAFAEAAQLRTRGLFAEALARLGQAEEVFQAAGLPVECAMAWMYQGSVYVAQTRPELAWQCQMAAEAVFVRHDLPARLAICHNEMATTLMVQGRLREADELYGRNLAVLGQLGMRADRVLVLNNLAGVRYYQGELTEALTLYQQVHAEFRDLGDGLGQGLSLANIGTMQAALGQFGTALRNLEAARRQLAALGSSDRVAHTLHSLGRAWLDLGDERRAIEHWTEAFGTYIATGARLAAARALVHMALAEARLGQTGQAMAHVARAREASLIAGAAGYAAICDQIAGQIHALAGNPEPAIEYLSAAEAEFVKLGMPLNAAACRIDRAAAYLAQQDLDAAQDLYESELAQRGRTLPDQAWRCTAGLAQIAERRRQPAATLEWHQRTVGYLRQLRRWLPHEGLVETFLTGRAEALQRAIAAAVAHDRAALALQFVEESRAQLLAQRLARTRSQAEAGAPPFEDREVVGLRRSLAELRHRLGARLELDQSWSILRSPDTETARLLDELEAIATAYQRQQALLEGDGAVEGNGPEFELAQLSRMLDDSAPGGWTCLAYYWLGDRLLTFSLTREGLALDCRDLQPLQRAALDLCAAPLADHRRLAYGAEAFRNPGQVRASRLHLQQLNNLLLPAAVRSRLTPEHVMIVVPAGPLHGLPFQALLDGEAYLCERTSLAYAPSLTTLAALPAQKPRLNRALVVALEHFGGDLPSLPHARREAERVAAHFPEATLLQDGAAHLAAVRDYCQDAYDVLHFATHAVYEARFGRLSRLVLHDDSWQADEIARDHLQAGLAVLSGCQTGLGQVYSGEEVIGLAQAFFAAGVPRVLATHWAVEDAEAPEFVAGFYAALRETGGRAAQALAEMQRAAIAAQRSPYAWAAYGFHGRP